MRLTTLAENARPAMSLPKENRATTAGPHRSIRRVATGLAALIVAALSATAAPVQAAPPSRPGEFGDAPEGIRAYSNVNGLPVTGAFPTHRAGASQAFHEALPREANFFFGQDVDYEWDAAPGCVASPYETDEPRDPADCDVGLAVSTLYTLDAYGIEQPLFGPGSEPFTGNAGRLVRWGRGPGTDIDLYVQNNSNQTVYVNALFDWDRDGTWSVGGAGGVAGAGTLEAAAAPGPSFVLAQLWNRSIYNFPVPPLFHGWLSTLQPPRFRLGAPGYVWARFTITSVMLGSPWVGQGYWIGGETEDSCIAIGPDGGEPFEGGEFGDAPHGVPAYIAGGVLTGQFPTCMGQFTPASQGYIFHAGNQGMRLGFGFDFEGDGNSDDCAFWNYDNDERFYDGDAGLLAPGAWTNGGGAETYIGGTQSPDIGPACGVAHWGTDIDMMLANGSTQTAYVNVLFDFDRNGYWGGSYFCNGNYVAEHAVVNATLSPGGNTTLSGILSPAVRDLRLGSGGWLWVRFSITDMAVPGDWDGSGIFGDGETEDYLLHIGPPAVAAAGLVEPAAFGLRLAQNTPNPISGSTRIAFELPAAGSGTLEIFDVAGRLVRTVRDGDFPSGRSEVEWDARDAAGAAVRPGIYLYRLTVGSRSVAKKLVVADR